MIRLYFIICMLIPFTGSIAQDTLSLQKAIELSLENNYALLISRNNLQIAQNNNTMGNAGMLPQLGLDAGSNNTVFNTHQVYSDGRVRDVDAARTNTSTGRIMLNWTIFDGFAMFVNKNKYNELEELSHIELKSNIENTIGLVILRYYNIAQQQQILQSLQNALNISTERYRLATAKQQIGTGSDLSVLQAELDRNADSSKYLTQLTILSKAKIELNQALARNPEITFVVYTEIPLLANLNYSDLSSKLTQQNLLLNAAQKNASIAALRIKTARAAYYPRISFSTGYSMSNTSSQAGIFEVNRGQGPMYGISASLSIFDGFNVSQNVKNAKIQQLSAEYSLMQTELDIKAEFNKLYNDYQAGLKLVNLETENSESAKRSTTLSFSLLKQGVLSDIDFRTAQQKQIEADIRLQSAIFYVKTCEIQLLLLCGEVGTMF